MNKQTALYPYSGILLSNKKQQTIVKCDSWDRSQGHCIEWKGFILYKSIYIIVLIRQNCSNEEKMGDCQEVG